MKHIAYAFLCLLALVLSPVIYFSTALVSIGNAYAQARSVGLLRDIGSWTRFVLVGLVAVPMNTLYWGTLSVFILPDAVMGAWYATTAGNPD